MAGSKHSQSLQNLAYNQYVNQFIRKIKISKCRGKWKYFLKYTVQFFYCEAIQ